MYNIVLHKTRYYTLCPTYLYVSCHFISADLNRKVVMVTYVNSLLRFAGKRQGQ